MKTKKRYIIGCLKDGKVAYAMTTSLGVPVFCYANANVYFNVKALEEDYELAKKVLVEGGEKKKPWAKNTRLFITRVDCKTNPFVLVNPSDIKPNNFDRNVKLRADIVDLRPEENENATCKSKKKK